MSNRIRQCARLAQVRSIQHDLAAMIAERAVRQVAALEASADQLSRLRLGFSAERGLSSGAALASQGELAMRLDLARDKLNASIDGAKARAQAASTARIAAKQQQESAERLTDKVKTDRARREDRKAQSTPPRRQRGGNAQ
jgi:hypothetical protein